MEPSLEGAVVAITGGARGIGRAAAEAMIDRGAKVAIGDLDLESVTAAADQLGPKAVGLELDVTDRSSFHEFIDSTETLFGPLDGLVNNAGVMILGSIEDESPESTATMIAVNLTGVINGTQLAIEVMKPRGRGRIINIASQVGKVGLAGGATYSATKSAVIGFSEAARAELKGSGLGVSWILPGVVDTPMAVGLPQIKLMDPLTPDDVGMAVATVMAEGGSEVWVPRLNRNLDTVSRLVPRRWRERLLGLTGADGVLAGADPSARTAYERDANPS